MGTILNPEAIGPVAEKIANFMSSRLIGQDEVIAEIVKLHQQQLVHLCFPGRPLGNLLLLGPTGTGKSRTVEVYAEAVHGSPRRLIRVDCAELQDSHMTARLIGAPPGYTGHEETDPLFTQKKLTDIAGKASISMVSFDEIEKANRTVHQLLLGILDKATLTTNRGSVNFERSFIFMTSNEGSMAMQQAYTPGMGFTPLVQTIKSADKIIKKRGVAAVRKKFSPEFVNRLDAICVFRAFDRETAGQILDLELELIQKAVSNPKHQNKINRFSFEFDPAARELLLDKGYDLKCNARELRRTINSLFLQKLANLLASGQVTDGTSLRIQRDGDILIFESV